MGDLAGALVITPAIVLWETDPLRWLEHRELIQSCLIYAATIAVGLIAFSPLLEQSPSRSSLAFLTMLPLMWAALRRNQRTKSLDDFYAGFSKRLCAFAETHDLLVKGDWHGADIRDLIRSCSLP